MWFLAAVPRATTGGKSSRCDAVPMHRPQLPDPPTNETTLPKQKENLRENHRGRLYSLPLTAIRY